MCNTYVYLCVSCIPYIDPVASKMTLIHTWSAFKQRKNPGLIVWPQFILNPHTSRQDQENQCHYRQSIRMAVSLRTSNTISIQVVEEEEMTKKEKKQLLQEINDEEKQIIKLGTKKKCRVPEVTQNPISDPPSSPSPLPSDNRTPPPPPLPSLLPPCNRHCPNIPNYCRGPLLYSKEVGE